MLISFSLITNSWINTIKSEEFELNEFAMIKCLDWCEVGKEIGILIPSTLGKRWVKHILKIKNVADIFRAQVGRQIVSHHIRVNIIVHQAVNINNACSSLII